MRLALILSLGLSLSGRAAWCSGLPSLASADLEVAKPRLKAAVAAPIEPKEWALMVFMSGRNDLGQFTAQDINRLEQIGSGAGADVLVQVATVEGGVGATRYHIIQDKDDSVIASQPENVPLVDMGSKSALVDFVKWTVKRYPAKKYALVIWGHGFGWAGNNGDGGEGKPSVSPDMVTGSSLSNKELASALKSVAKILGKPVDIFATDSCGMQMLSVIAELKNSVNIVIGSEETVPADFGFPYSGLVERLNSAPQTSAEDFAKFIAAAYQESHPSHIGVSAVKASEVGNFVKVLNAWIDVVVSSDRYGDITEAITVLPGFYGYSQAADLTSNPMSKDIFQIVEVVTDALSRPKDGVPGLKAAARNVLDFKSSIVIANSQGDMSGLAEYVPKELYNSAYDETYFAKISRWDDFMKWVLDQTYSYPQANSSGHPVRAEH